MVDGLSVLCEDVSVAVVAGALSLTTARTIVLSRDVEAVIFQQLPLPHLSLPLPLTKDEKTTTDIF